MNKPIHTTMTQEQTVATKSRTFHMSQSIEGPLRNWRVRDWKNATKWLTRKDGSRFTPEELKDEFLRMHGEGIKVIPYGGPCDGFDYQKGCPGHEDPNQPEQP